MTTQIHCISDKAPEFPCWLWHEDTGSKFWQKCMSQADFYCTYGYYSATHWHPDQPEAPTATPPTEQAREVAQGIIDGCVHPDIAVRRISVDLAPLRALLQSHPVDSTRPKDGPGDREIVDWLAKQIGPGYAGGIVMVVNLIPTHGGDFRSACRTAMQSQEKAPDSKEGVC